MNPVWRSLEKDFRDIPDTFGDLRADWSHQPNLPNHWRLAEGASYAVRDRFEAIARLAGKELAFRPGVGQRMSEEILAETNPGRAREPLSAESLRALSMEWSVVTR